MPTKPPLKLSDASPLRAVVKPTDLLVGLGRNATTQALENATWTAQTFADFVKQQAGAGVVATTLTDTQVLLTATVPAVSAGSLYAILGTQIDDSNPALGTWNGAGALVTVYVQALSATAFDVTGTVLQTDGTLVAVSVDVAAGTFVVSDVAARLGTTTPTDPAAPLSAISTTFPYTGHGPNGLVGETDLTTAAETYATVEFNTALATLVGDTQILDTLLLGNGADVTLAAGARLYLLGRSAIKGVSFVPPNGGANTGTIYLRPETTGGTPSPFDAYQLHDGVGQQPIVFRGGNPSATGAAVALVNFKQLAPITNEKGYVVTVYLVGTSPVPPVGPRVKVVQLGVTVTEDTASFYHPSEEAQAFYQTDSLSLYELGETIAADRLANPGGGGGTPSTPTGGIDYAHPVPLTQATTLAANKAYYVDGNSYALTLPDPAANLGTAIYLEVAATATGLFAVSNGQLLRAGESSIVRATPSGWAISTKQLVPLVARVETTTAQQGSFQGVYDVPFSAVVQDSVGMCTGATITIRRSGQYALTTGGAIKNASGQGQNVISLIANPNTASEKYLISNGAAITDSGIGDSYVGYVGYLAAGTVIGTRFYCEMGAALRGQFAGAIILLAVAEQPS
jgi:hypothetical protein